LLNCFLKLDPSLAGLGYNVATPEYLSKSVQYFQSKYKNIIFVIATLDKKWTQTHMPNNTIVEYLSHPKREFLVATLALCDHTITTVGSFGNCFISFYLYVITESQLFS
jgi:hypothetical protein